MGLAKKRKVEMNNNKALWFYSPIKHSIPAQTQMKSFIKKLADDTHMLIDAIHIKGSGFNKESRRIPDEMRGKFEKLYDLEITKNIEGLKDSLNSFNIITQNQSGRDKDLELAIKKIDESNPSFVITNSHGSKGLERLWVGSFTEGLISKIKKPIICISENASIRSMKTAFMPTDLSKSDFSLIKTILSDSCFKFLEKIVIFNHINCNQFLDHPHSHGQLFGLEGFEPFFDEMKECNSKNLRGWVAELKKDFKNINIDSKTVSSYNSTEDEIINQSFGIGTGIILFKKKKNSLFPSYLGSISKKVIRNSKAPVCILSEKF